MIKLAYKILVQTALIFSVLLCCAPCFAGEKCPCDVFLYVMGCDTSGTNLRDAPNGTAMLVLTDNISIMHYLTLCDYSEGWFKIKKIYAEYTGMDQEDLGLTVDGELWIHNSLLETGLRHDSKNYIPIFKAPDNKSQVMHSITMEYEGYTFIGCKNGWLKCLFTEGELTGATGWLAPVNQCSNPYTTCP